MDTNDLLNFNFGGNTPKANNTGFLDFSSNSGGILDFFNTQNNPNFSNLGGAGAGITPQNKGFLDFFNSDTLNNIGTGVDAASSLFNIYQGMKSLNLGQDTFNLNKDALTTNLANQANLTNERLNTRQASRLRSQGLDDRAVDQGVAEFMQKYGVSGQLGG